MSSNIISLDQQRRLKSLKEQEVSFKGYLTQLKHEELQYEANHIINKVHEENLSEEFLLKSALLMEELANRVEATKMSNTITKFSTNIRARLDKKLQ